MKTTAIIATAAAAAVLGPMGITSATAASASWEPLDQYASESGDSYYVVERNHDGRIRFRVRIAADYYDRTKICVRKIKPGKKTKWVCHTVRMKPTGDFDIHQGKIRWQGNYPSKGSAERKVRFGGSPGAVKLRFTP